jgi:hypothetical protein
VRPYRQASPSPARHRPALGLRAGAVARTLVPQANLEKETQPMWLTSVLDFLKSTSPQTRSRRDLHARVRERE